MFPREKGVPMGSKISSLGNKNSLGKFRISHGKKLSTNVPMGNCSSDGNFKIPMGKVLFPMGTLTFPMETSNIPMGIFKFPMGNVLLISCGDNSDHDDMLGHMGKFNFFDYLSLGQKIFLISCKPTKSDLPILEWQICPAQCLRFGSGEVKKVVGYLLENIH